jgi:hypothetical protein
MTTSKEITRKVTRRIVLRRNGDPIHFDVEIDLDMLAIRLGPKAEKNRTNAASAVYGAIKVKLIP